MEKHKNDKYFNRINFEDFKSSSRLRRWAGQDIQFHAMYATYQVYVKVFYKHIHQILAKLYYISWQNSL